MRHTWVFGAEKWMDSFRGGFTVLRNLQTGTFSSWWTSKSRTWKISISLENVSFSGLIFNGHWHYWEKFFIFRLLFLYRFDLEVEYKMCCWRQICTARESVYFFCTICQRTFVCLFTLVFIYFFYLLNALVCLINVFFSLKKNKRKSFCTSKRLVFHVLGNREIQM